MLKMRKSKFIKNLCFLIGIVMLSSLILTSCSGSGASYEDVVRRTPLTLSLYVISENATPEAVAEVEKALNQITEIKLTTRLKLVALPASEYIATINDLFEKYDESVALKAEQDSIRSSIERASREQARLDRAAGITQAPTRRPTDPPKTTEFYEEKIVYPDLEENQLDIFLISSSDIFEEFARERRFAAVDEELSTKAKVLYEYIHPSIMQAGQFNGNTFAIPTNKMIGEFTYLAINKRLLEEYNVYAENYNEQIEEEIIEGDPKSVVDIERLRDIDSLRDYLQYVRDNYPDVAMIEGPISIDRNYEPLFPEYPRFALAANAGRSVVYTPPSMPVPTEPRTAAPETDEDGNIIEVETEPPTIPRETVKPQLIPAVINNAPDRVNPLNRLAAAATANNSKTNQFFRDERLFATGAISPDAERAAFLKTGTLEDYYGWIQTDAH